MAVTSEGAVLVTIFLCCSVPVALMLLTLFGAYRVYYKHEKSHVKHIKAYKKWTCCEKCNPNAKPTIDPNSEFAQTKEGEQALADEKAGKYDDISRSEYYPAVEDDGAPKSDYVKGGKKSNEREPSPAATSEKSEEALKKSEEAPEKSEEAQKESEEAIVNQNKNDKKEGSVRMQEPTPPVQPVHKEPEKEKSAPIVPPPPPPEKEKSSRMPPPPPPPQEQQAPPPPPPQNKVS